MARPLDPFAEQVDGARAVPRCDRGGRSRSGAGARARHGAEVRVRRTAAPEARTSPAPALEWDLEILQHLTTPTTTEMPRGYELYEQRGGRLPELVYDDWAENVMLFDDPAGAPRRSRSSARRGRRSGCSSGWASAASITSWWSGRCDSSPKR